MDMTTDNEITISLDFPVCPGCGGDDLEFMSFKALLCNHNVCIDCGQEFIDRLFADNVYLIFKDVTDESVAKYRDFTVRDLAEMYLAKKWELENYKAMARFVSQAE